MVWRLCVAPMLALLVAMPVIVDQAAAQRRGGWDERGPRRNWELVGSTRINGLRIDRDTIQIDKRDGPFTRIGVMAREGGVYLYEIKVVFGNNEVQTFRVRKHLAAGERTRPFDLRGKKRGIKRITVAARRGRNVRRRTYVDVFAETVGKRNRWEVLGKKTVSFRVDRDVIRVGRREGRFEKIALEVADSDVEIRDLKVFFRRGRPQDVRVRQLIRAGGRTRPIDLAGGDRIIERIELVYRSRRGGTGRARVTVLGLPGEGRRGPPPRPRAHWEQLGCQKVGFGADRDVIKVGRREGRFSAIRLRVERSDVLILNLKVVYARGAADDFEVKKRIRAGDATPPLDLRGERRAINRVEMVYTSIPSFKGSARLCVDGREVGRRR